MIFYAVPGGDGVLRARSTARAARKSFSMSTATGCAPPRTRRAVRSVSSSVVAASRTSSSVAAGSAKSVRAQHHLIQATLGRELLDTDNFIEDIIGPEPKREQVDGPEFDLWHKRASELRALLASPEIADMYQTFVAAEAEYDELEQLWKKTLV